MTVGSRSNKVGTNGSAMFQCQGFGDCRMVFTRSEHLARHIRKHTGERPFQCHCLKSFSRLDNLRQHCQTVHEDKPEQNEQLLAKLAELHANMSSSSSRSHKLVIEHGISGDSNKKRKGALGHEFGEAAKTKRRMYGPDFPVHESYMPKSPTQGTHRHSDHVVFASSTTDGSNVSGLNRTLQSHPVQPYGYPSLTGRVSPPYIFAGGYGRPGHNNVDSLVGSGLTPPLMTPLKYSFSSMERHRGRPYLKPLPSLSPEPAFHPSSAASKAPQNTTDLYLLHSKLSKESSPHRYSSFLSTVDSEKGLLLPSMLDRSRESLSNPPARSLDPHSTSLSGWSPLSAERRYNNRPYVLPSLDFRERDTDFGQTKPLSSGTLDVATLKPEVLKPKFLPHPATRYDRDDLDMKYNRSSNLESYHSFQSRPLSYEGRRLASDRLPEERESVRSSINGVRLLTHPTSTRPISRDLVHRESIDGFLGRRDLRKAPLLKPFKSLESQSSLHAMPSFNHDGSRYSTMCPEAHRPYALTN